MPRAPVDDVFSSSPAHPSHHNKRNPYAQAQRNFNLKRTAAAAALPSPPTTQSKRKHYDVQALSDSENEHEDDVEKTPTKATTRSKSAVLESANQATPRTRSTKASNAPPAAASPALSITDIQESGRRSPSPFPYREPSPQPLNIHTSGRALKTLAEDDSDSDSGESAIEPATPKAKRRAPATPPPTRQTRARGPIRDTPHNPFLSTSPRYPKRDTTPLNEKETITYVFRGIKVPQPNYMAKRAGQPDPAALSPSNSDYSPSASFVPKLLFPSSSASPTPKSRTRSAGGQRPQTPTRETQVLPFMSKPSKAKPVARKLFAAEIAAAEAQAGDENKPKPNSWAESSTTSTSTSVSESQGALNAKAKALKQGIKKGQMSASMGVAHAHGPVRPGERSNALHREDTFEFQNQGSKAKARKHEEVDDDDEGLLSSSPLRRSSRVAMLAKPSPRSPQK